MDRNVLKGDDFINRYRIDGRLKTRSPLHIGTGKSDPMKVKGNKDGEIQTSEVSLVARDHMNKPVIPGTAIKGVLRHWLLHVLQGVGGRWAVDRDFNVKKYEEMKQEDQHKEIKDEFSVLEMLFGTPFNAGKVEVWDAKCITNVGKTNDSFLNWNHDKLTYTVTSVVIDPERGTAKKNLLFNNEVVPPGVEFELSLVGQNLTESELGLILFALEGFNSDIYPVQIGARSGVGYGLFEFSDLRVTELKSSDVSEWLKSIMDKAGKEEDSATKAGYFALPEWGAERQKEIVGSVKAAMLNEMRKDDVR